MKFEDIDSRNRLKDHFKRNHSITVEYMSSLSAATTFNFLNQEGRDVAAALLPNTNEFDEINVLDESV